MIDLFTTNEAKLRRAAEQRAAAFREALAEQPARRQNSIEPIEFLSGFLTERLAIERGIEWTPAIHDLCNRAIEEEKLAEQPAQQEPEVGVGAENGAKPSETRMDTGFSGGGNPPAQQQVPRAARGDWGAKRKQPAQQQEPVAWMWHHPTGGFRSQPLTQLSFNPGPSNFHGWNITPLYTSPQPAIPQGWRLVLVEKLMALKASIHGECYMGEEWEKETVAAMLNAAPQPAQPSKPVAEVISNDKHALGEQTIAVDAPLEIGTVLYTSPPANANAGKPWVGLTDEDIGAACGFAEHTTASTRFALKAISRAIEAKLKEKNA